MITASVFGHLYKLILNVGTHEADEGLFLDLGLVQEGSDEGGTSWSIAQSHAEVHEDEAIHGLVGSCPVFDLLEGLISVCATVARKTKLFEHAPNSHLVEQAVLSHENRRVVRLLGHYVDF